MTRAQIDSIISKANLRMIKNEHIRLGQALMAELFFEDKTVYDIVSGSINDPFYHDSRIDTFLKFIES